MASDPEEISPDFWNTRYAAGKTPWDFGGVPPALRDYLRRASGSGRVLIPGCGSGYEVKAFHDAGYEVTAIDFSPGAVERAKAVLGPLGDRVFQGDFFTFDLAAAGGLFDLIYERTFLCALPPARRGDYARRMAELLKPGGVLAGIFFYGVELDPPPHPLTDGEAELLFSGGFCLKNSEPVPGAESTLLFAGRERWQEWVRK